MTFAEKLRELRQAAGLSEAKLAKAAGVEFAALREYAMSRRKPPFAAVLKLARAMGVSCEAFADSSDLVGESKDSPAPALGGKKPPARKPNRSGSGTGGS